VVVHIAVLRLDLALHVLLLMVPGVGDELLLGHPLHHLVDAPGGLGAGSSVQSIIIIHVLPA